MNGTKGAAIRPATVLLVEDSLVESELLRRTLIAGGFSVVSARNGEEALVAARTEPPDLVMSDIRMPFMDGYTLCRAIKRDPALAHVPVVLLSVLSEPQDIIEAIDAGADSYTVKPYTEASLIGRLHSLLGAPTRGVAADGTLEVEYRGQRHRLHSDPQQMLNLLLSVYENILAQNRELMTIQAQLSLLNDTLEDQVRERTAQLRASEARLEERVVARTAELTAANAELERFAYAVSHDLRSPLRAMAGFASLLREDYGERLDATGHDYLEHVVAGAQRMDELIAALLGLARVARGELQRGEVDVSALAARLLGELADAEPGRQVAWEVEPGLRVRGDARMLEVLMTNLLDNAWKYTMHRTSARIRVYAEVVEGVRCVCVADNGAGFDMGVAGKLFEPFRRLHGEDEFPGLGIGLATARRIVQRHGGTIGAEARPGEGAVFRFSLPERCDVLDDVAAGAPQ